MADELKPLLVLMATPDCRGFIWKVVKHEGTKPGNNVNSLLASAAINLFSIVQTLFPLGATPLDPEEPKQIFEISESQLTRMLQQAKQGKIVQ